MMSRQPFLVLGSLLVVMVTFTTPQTARANAAPSIPSVPSTPSVPPHLQTIDIASSTAAPLRWAGNQTTMVFNNQIDPGQPNLPSNVQNGSTPYAAFLAAGQAWSDTSGFTFQDGGFVSTQNAANDGTHLITFADTPVNQSASQNFVAVTLWMWNGSHLFDDVDIVMNPSIDFSTLGNPNRFDVGSVATHETGHAFGLSHSGACSASMFAFLAPGETRGQTLTADDVAGINHTYPSPAFIARTGTIAGTVMKNGSPVYGAHVVARSVVTGETVTTTLSQPNGVYEIVGLPAGPYHVYLEPVDFPYADGHVVNGYWVAGKDTSIPTMFYGTGATPDIVDVDAGTTTSAIDFVVPVATPNLNVYFLALTPSSTTFSSVAPLGVEIEQGTNTFLVVGGTGALATLPDSGFEIAGNGVNLSTSTGSGILLGVNGGTYKIFPLAVLADAAPGLRDLTVTNSMTGEVSIFCAAIDVRPSATPSALAVPYGEGCTGPGGTLTVVANGLPTIGNLGFGLAVNDASPGENAIFVFARAPSFRDIGSGCTEWIATDQLYVPATFFQAPVNGAGDALLPLGVPAVPALSGLRLYIQAAATEPTVPLGFVASQGLFLELQ